MFGPILLSKYVTKENLHYLMIFQGVAIISWGFVQNNFYISLLALFIGLMASLTSVDIITTLLGIAFFAFAFYYTRILKWI